VFNSAPRNAATTPTGSQYSPPRVSVINPMPATMTEIASSAAAVALPRIQDPSAHSGGRPQGRFSTASHGASTAPTTISSMPSAVRL